MQNPSKNGSHSRPIVQCFSHDLQPGKLDSLFQEGAKAVILQDDDRVKKIWEGLLGLNEKYESPSYHAGLHPWNNNILDIAQNHHSGDIMFGDVFRFIPGDYAQISRKIVIFPDSDGTMRIIPEDLFVGSQRVIFPQAVLTETWTLMEDVVHSIIPVNTLPRPYALRIELIKYPNSHDHVEKVVPLLLDGFGSLAYWGYCMKRARSSAVGFFDFWGIRLIYALSTFIPGIKSLSMKLNNIMKPFSKKNNPKGTQCIHFPHVDTGKAITALIGERSAVSTEIYDGKKWVDLPLSSTSLACFPGKNGGQPTRVAPSMHRVLIQNQASDPVIDSPNISILLGVIELPVFG